MASGLVSTAVQLGSSLGFSVLIALVVVLFFVLPKKHKLDN